MSDTPLSADVYSVREAFEDLKKNFIEEESDETLELGMYGFLSAVLAKETASVIKVGSEMANEMFPSKARLESSIMSHAVVNSITDIFAAPSKMPCLVCIIEDDLKRIFENQITEDNPNTVVIDNKSPIYIEDYEYHFDYPIIISKNQISTFETVYTARYDISDPNSISDITNPYLASPYLLKYSSYVYLFIPTRLTQISINESYEKISSDNIIDNKSYEFEFNENNDPLIKLASFDVYVKEEGETVKLTPIFESAAIDEDVPYYCRYLFLNKNTIRVTFDKNSYMPGINAEITTVIKTTLGEKGNIILKEKTASILQDTENYSYFNTQLMIIPQGKSEGGADNISIAELKRRIPQEASSRKNLTSSSDLNAYFNRFNTDKLYMDFSLKVNNQFMFQYYSYILAKDNDNRIVPTNTLPAVISTEDLDTIKDSDENELYVLNPGICLGWKKGKCYLINEKKDKKEDYQYIYTIPFKAIINPKIPAIFYYINIMNKNYILNFNYINDQCPVQFICTNAQWRRDPDSIENSGKDYIMDLVISQNINEDYGLMKVLKPGDEGYIEPPEPEPGKYIKVEGYLDPIKNRVYVKDLDTGNYTVYDKAGVKKGTVTDNPTNNEGEGIGIDINLIDSSIEADQFKKMQITIENPEYKEPKTISVKGFSNTELGHNYVNNSDGSYSVYSSETGELLGTLTEESTDESLGISYSALNAKLLANELPEADVEIPNPKYEESNDKSDEDENEGLGEIITGYLNETLYHLYVQTEDSTDYKVYNFSTKKLLGSITEGTTDEESDFMVGYETVRKSIKNDLFKQRTMFIPSSSNEEPEDGEDNNDEDIDIEKMSLSSEPESAAYTEPDDPELVDAYINANTPITVLRGIKAVSGGTADEVSDSNINKNNILSTISEVNGGNANTSSDIQTVNESDDEMESTLKQVTEINPLGADVSQNTAKNVRTIFDPEDAEIINVISNVGVIAVCKKNGNAVRYYISEPSETPEEGKFEYQVKIKFTTDDYIDYDNNIRIYGGTEINKEKGKGSEFIYLPRNTDIDIYVLASFKDKYGDVIEFGRYDLDEIIPPSVTKGLTVTNKYTINDGVDFYDDYSNIVSSIVRAEPKRISGDEKLGYTFNLSDVPMIGYNYALNKEKLYDFLDKLKTQKDHIDDILSIVNNGFTVDFKFYNTYGQSLMYTVDNIIGIGKVNMSFEFNVYLKKASDNYTVEYIKRDIKNYIEDYNNINNSIHLPNLIAYIINAYSNSIYYFEFKGFNTETKNSSIGGYLYGPECQHLYIKDYYIGRVPEFINIDVDENGAPDITINAVYQH